MDEPKVTISIPKRWLQFRLRALLLLTLLLAIILPFLVDQPKPAVLALDGYCPVTLINAQRWTLGNPKYSETYQGLTYYFVGRVEQDKFVRFKARYTLAADGVDVVLAEKTGEEVLGTRRYGFRYGDRTFLFSNQASANEFAAAPNSYAKFADDLVAGH